MADSKQYTALYLVAKEKLEYENRLREIEEMSPLRRAFTIRPRDPFPQFGSFLEATRAFSDSFKNAHPEMNRNLPGKEGPCSYSLEFWLEYGLGGGLMGRSVVSSEVTSRSRSEWYLFNPDRKTESFKGEKERLSEGAFSDYYYRLDKFRKEEAESLFLTPKELISRSEKVRYIKEYKEEKAHREELEDKYRLFKKVEDPEIDTVRDYVGVKLHNENINRAFLNGNYGYVRDIVPGGATKQIQLEIADAHYQNNLFALNTYHDLHLGDELSKLLEHGGPFGYNPSSLGYIASLSFELPTQEVFAYSAMMQFHGADEIRKFVKENEEFFCTVDDLHGSLEMGFGRAREFFVEKFDKAMESVGPYTPDSPGFHETYGNVLSSVREAIREEGEKVLEDIRIKGDTDRAENQRLGQEIRNIVEVVPNKKEFVELSDGRRIIPAEVKFRKNGDWEAPIYAPAIITAKLLPLTEGREMDIVHLNSVIADMNSRNFHNEAEFNTEFGIRFAGEIYSSFPSREKGEELLKEFGFESSIDSYIKRYDEISRMNGIDVSSEEKQATVEVRTVEGIKDSKGDYEIAMSRIKDELERYARAGENPDKAVVAGITGYYCGVKGVNVDSMSKALSDAGITGADDNLYALDEYESGMKVQESLEKDEEKELGVKESKVVSIKR